MSFEDEPAAEDFPLPIEAEVRDTLPASPDPVLQEIAKLGNTVTKLLVVERDNNRALHGIWTDMKDVKKTLENHEVRIGALEDKLRPAAE